MRTTRRKFLKWSSVGALGAVVFGGCTIPESALLVQSPVRMPEDLVSGLEAWYATSCGQCGAGEGIIVRVIEGRAIKIEGNPDHPVSRGKSVAMCQAGLQSLYNPARLRAPMKLTGSRGSGQYQEITWEEAYAEVVDSLRSADPARVALMTEPLRGTLGMMAGKFMEAYGGQHLGYEALERTTLKAAVQQVFGAERLPDFDIDHSDYILSFGADFLSSWLSPTRYNRGYGEFRQGGNERGTLIQVESRFSMTAANADKWVFVRPGREGEVAVSIAYVLMTEYAGAIDAAAANALTGGQGATVLGTFTPEAVAQTSGVSAERIRELAKALAEHPNSIVLGGGSAGATSNGLSNLKAIYSLNHLIGSVGRSGGVVFNPASPLGDLPAEGKAGPFEEWQGLADRMRGGQVQVAMVHGANPAYGLPTAVGFEEALNGAGKIISFSSFMDETTRWADLILPDHVYLESWGDDVPEPGPGYQVVTFQQPVVRPLYRTRAFGDSLLAVAKELGSSVAAALPWATMKEAVQETALKLQALARGSVQSGDARSFWNAVLQRGGWWDLDAKGERPAEGPPALPTNAVEPRFEGPTSGASFFLVPFVSNSLGDGKGANLPWLQAAPDPVTTVVWHTWVELSMSKAQELGIKEGDELEIEGAGGRRIVAKAYLHPGVSPDVVCIPTGQGHTHYGDFLVGPDVSRFQNGVGTGRGPNVFAPLAAAKVEGSGALAWAANRVSIRKTGNSGRLAKLEGPVFPDFHDVEAYWPIRKPESSH
ncbi:MAG: molybdopterin-dependent oxidoreductase [Chloroflexi bacterium]|nr:molybdopterin-dependent oxidoreductase [Chloroflexota bacterium]